MSADSPEEWTHLQSQPTTIWKYQIPVTAINMAIALPLDAEIVHVGESPGFSDIVQMWVRRPDAPDTGLVLKARIFQVFGTGHPIPPGWRHRGTVLTRTFVWHLMEKVT